MQGTGSSTLITYVIVLALVGFAIYRRTRTQVVQPTRAVVTAALIVVLSGVGLVSSGLSHPLALILAPLALAAGLAIGWVMMGTIQFWRDDAGQLWMKGGLLYIAIWLASLVIRLGVGFASGAPPGGGFGAPAASQNVPEGLAVLSADLLLVSIGLWIARAAALVQRYRANQHPR